MVTAPKRPPSALVPASAIPLAYYAFAHAALALGLLVLAADPELPGTSFYHPRMVALVHVVTLAWMSGSILGSLYIVAPLALRVSMPTRFIDWLAFACFVAGTAGMVVSFWRGRYDDTAWAAGFVTIAIGWVGWRVCRGLPASPAPRGVSLHVVLAFVNILAAAVLGILIGLDRSRGFLGVSPLAATFAHAHLAAVGWGLMMVVGLSYRLIPMMLPAAMPTGAGLATSAVLLEIGLAVLIVALLVNSPVVPLGALLIVAGLASFVTKIRQSARQRMPRPPALPARDWSTWQAHGALGWLLIAVVVGLALSIGWTGEHRLTAMWLYGTAGLVGFLGQMVAGMQGRLVPWYAWYRAFAAAGEPPDVAANALPSATWAKPIFLGWTIGVPMLAAGLAFESTVVLATGAGLLAGSVVLGGAYLARILRTARGI